jgi:hypothetical protein
MAVVPGTPITQGDLAALAALANSKTNLAGTPYSFPDWAGVARDSGSNPKWLTELNRLRGNLLPQIASMVSTNGGIYPWQQQSISGGDATPNKVAGWPLSGPSVNNKNLAFWYAATGSPVTASISASGLVESNGPFSTQNGNYLSVSNPYGLGYSFSLQPCAFVTQQTFSIFIGGGTPSLVQGDFVIGCALTIGASYISGTNTSTPDPGPYPVPSSIDVSKWIPGANTPTVSSPSGGYVWILLRVNQIVNPGRYSVTVNLPLINDTIVGSTGTIYSRLTFNYPPIYVMQGFALNTANSGQGSGQATITGFTVGPGQPAPGIHGTKNVLKIDCSSFYRDAPFGIISLQSNQATGNTPPLVIFDLHLPTLYPANPTINFQPELALEGQTVSITTTTPGYWTGNSAAVSNLNVPTLAQMPWNLQRTQNKTGGGTFTENPMLQGNSASYPAAGPLNTYNQSLPVEQQTEPPSWAASTKFSVGFCIIDAKQNFQIVTVAGTSGGSAPNWNNVLNGTTTDGTVTWTCYKVQVAPDGWQSSTAFGLGTQIIDKNGNTQQSVDMWQAAKSYGLSTAIVDINGNAQLVTTAGVTGSVQPTWATTIGQYTTDGSVVWQCGGPQPRVSDSSVEPTWSKVFGGLTQDLFVLWKMVKACRPLAPAVHRPVAVPRYPVYWQSETIPALMPPANSSESTKTVWGAGNQWQRNNYTGGHDNGWQYDNLAKGWWIYSVSLNRCQFEVADPGATGIGNTTFGAGSSTPGMGGSAAEVQVTIGCIRNGSFVAFGTWQTGQTIQVLWPVFTSDALVYQCSERVDIQAVAIAAGGAGVSTGTSAAGYPICAAFISDITALLNYIT